MSNLIFIKAPCHNSTRQNGFELAPNEIKEKYDYEISIEEFNKKNNFNIAKGYDLLYNLILDLNNKFPNKKIITIGGDHSISAATIPAFNEKFMIKQGETVSSNLKILWIDLYPDLHTFKTLIAPDLNNMAVSSLVGLLEPTFVHHKLLLKPEQIIFFGIDDDADILDIVVECGFKYFTIKKIKSLGIEQILKYLKRTIQDHPLFISLDIKALDKSIVPCSENNLNIGLMENEIKLIFDFFKNQIAAMDIVEFNPLLGTIQETKTTRETIRRCLIYAFNLKEKSINIFTEDSEFLIFRPLNQLDPLDIGWYILRGLNLDKKNEIIKLLEKDQIETICIDNEDYLVTKTTINEQNAKSCYAAQTINDIVLFQSEKMDMTFELINSN
ncbi:Arginase family protein [uncultured virus]|nr:Arginase family protein [uncultured virus]